MDKKQILTTLCKKRMQYLNISDKLHLERLNYELIEIDVQDKYDYFLKSYHDNKKWKHNEHNLLVPYLLGLCPNFDIHKEPDSVMGEYPDIDMDFLDVIREYLRNSWAHDQFGSENVCYIGTYQTYVLKQAILDMARVFGLDRYAILDITKQFATKDDEGDALSWDKAVELYPAFKNWCDEHKEAAEAAKMLLGRNRNMSQHAGGFIISSKKLSGFAPLVKNKKDDSLMTAWPEGQTVQELMSVGLVKMDFLSSENQSQIVDCVGLILKRYNLPEICARPGLGNWSDDGYLEDEKVLEMANKGDLRFIFQFDSDGIRKLVRTGGVTKFSDLVAYNALYRPGALNKGMHEVYCNRKKGLEQYEIHPLLKPYLEDTYGVMCFQESIMQVLHVAGRIPKRDTYDVVKAISKKKIEKFAKYKDTFVRNAQITLQISEEEALQWWNNAEEFASYGFNKSHSCVYAVQAARQLYLKCYFPVEFYCTRLGHLHGDDEKLRDCIRDAAAHGVKVKSIDINKSQVDFSIVPVKDEPSNEDEIYFGLSKIKYFSNNAAKRIIELRNDRPFKDYKDFLCRFGFDAKENLALVSLGVFNEADPVTLWKYYEYYKDTQTRTKGRRSRFGVAVEKYKEKLFNVVGDKYELNLNDIDLAIETEKDEGILKQLRRIRGNFQRTVDNFNKREAEVQTMPPVCSFDPSLWTKPIKQNNLEVLQDKEKAEITFLGFLWAHPLDSCEDVQGFTFDYCRTNAEYGKVCPIEAIIKENKEQVSKKGNTYRVLKLLDANWEIGFVNIWMTEVERFNDKMRPGLPIRMRVMPPNPKFGGARYSMESVPKYLAHKNPYPPNEDPRLIILQPKGTND